MKKIKGICLVILLLFGMTACKEKGIREPEGVVTGEVFAERDKNTDRMSWQGSRALLTYPTDKSADEMLAMTKDGSLLAEFVVMEDSDITHGEDVWDEFFQMTREGKNAQIQIANYYTLDREGVSEEYYEQNKDNYPVIYLSSLLFFDGNFYHLTRGNNTREIENGDYGEWKYLLELYDEPSSPSARFTSCEHYVLTNDDTVTWKKLEWGMFSSQLGDYIAHRTVIRKYKWKE